MKQASTNTVKCDKKLAGAAKTSHIKKCTADAAKPMADAGKPMADAKPMAEAKKK